VAAYDNFEHMEGVKQQRIDSNSTFKSVTTGEIIQGREMPPEGFQQNMLDPTVRLRTSEVLFAPGNMADDMECQVCIHTAGAFVLTVYSFRYLGFL
jgi:hypothetical protein